MQLHELPSGNNKERKRIGRSGKRGSYSGRGVKGQKSRAGRRIRPAVRDLIIRLPKRKGFKNKPKNPPAVIINLETIDTKVPKEQKSIDIALLKQLRLVPSRYRGKVKILGDGALSSAFVFKGLDTSKTAAEKIKAAGGSVERAQS